MELRKSNAVLLYVLLHFPDGLKEKDLYKIISIAQKIHADKFKTNIIGRFSRVKGDDCISLVSNAIKKLKNKEMNKQDDDISR